MMQEKMPNLLFIMTDQQRFDAFRRVQDELEEYRGKFKIRTPNLDRIAASGVYFRTAYCASPICGPSRVSLRSGNTVERTGCRTNDLVDEKTYSLSRHYEQKIKAIESYDQVLAEEQGYNAEHYGKWHMPLRLYNERLSDKPAISYNSYNFKTKRPLLDTTQKQFTPTYKKSIGALKKESNVSREVGAGILPKGQLLNPTSGYPYTPLRLDARFGMKNGNDHNVKNAGVIVGRDSLPSKWSSTSVIGEMSIRALERLAKSSVPFALTVSFMNPHPPYIAAPDYFDFYNENQSKLLIPKSLFDSMTNSAYQKQNKRGVMLGFENTSAPIAEWTATYYAMVEEIDSWIGQLLDTLDTAGVTNKTMVVFTSDHGEMLGSHDMRGKANLLEEATRVPLLMSFPGRIQPQTVVDDVVSHIDVFSTIMDYLGASQYDRSDGMSLRRFIEKTSFNQKYDEHIVISQIGKNPNYMIRKGPYKLIITRKQPPKSIDMVYNLEQDPYEMNNLLSENKDETSLETIGKAEHLKILLLEWMERNDGPFSYFSDSENGDMVDISNRRTWRKVDYWQSDTEISFGKPVLWDEEYIRNEYFYLGRTSAGQLRISRVYIQGRGGQYFHVDHQEGAFLENGEYLRIKVSFQSTEPLDIALLDAYVVIQNDVNGINKIKIVSA